MRTRTHKQDCDAATKTLETPDDDTQTDEQCRKSHKSQLVEDTRVFLPMKLFSRSELEKIKCLNIIYLLIFIIADNNERV